MVIEDVCLSSTNYGSSVAQNEGQIRSMILDFQFFFVICFVPVGIKDIV